MDGRKVHDHYEELQISPRADRETIERVFRHLAKRYHPDNRESGNAERFERVVEAYRVLSDEEQRARYDVQYDLTRREQWRIFDQKSTADEMESDRRIRQGLLALLYRARRSDPDRPGTGIVDLERLLGCPEEHMKFHVWYLKEKGWLQRLENGALAITAAGVDHVIGSGDSALVTPYLLARGPGDGPTSPSGGA